MKCCTGCGLDKEPESFHKSRATKDGLCHRCKVCVLAYQEANREAMRVRSREYHKANRDRLVARMAAWREADPERARECRARHVAKHADRIKALRRASRQKPENRQREREYNAEWRAKNKDKARAQDRERYHAQRKHDVRYRLAKNIANGIRKSVKGGKAGARWESLVGYDLDALVSRLRRTMPPGFSWADYIAGRLHIDHIVPVVAFSFASTGDFDFRRCWALGNLRLLPARENCRKGGRLLAPFQASLPNL